MLRVVKKGIEVVVLMMKELHNLSIIGKIIKYLPICILIHL